ncbi:MAG: 1-deoxy-D-xylulose-5-phosphate synthase [Candidatus Omnitrophica bacterium]|nr:1-deoxy-D-xylulose-5-phosphate synthase [Candidatus Omnitrophota bacterium]
MARLLDQINSPADLRALRRDQLPQVAQEIRDVIIQTVSKTGGHLGGSLGAVELVLSLHYAFNTPEDHLVWDVGYQAYAHKLITGRRDRFHTLRQLGGISGFPHRDESPYDLFTIGHGCTSIGTAFGLARARDHHGQHHKVVAIIGDGSLPGGMALEALNNAGHSSTDFLIILNDNKMAIAPATGALSRTLNRIITDPLYNRLRRTLEGRMQRLPKLGFRIVRLARRVEEHLKSYLTPGLIFEELGFRYFGPVDGHDTDQLVKTLSNIKALPGPKILHVITVKGKGLSYAEQEQWKYHGVVPFDPATGEFIKKPSSETYTQRFGKAVIALAEQDPAIVAITAAMPDGTGLVEYSKRFPERFYDVGMCEQYAVAFAAGLAKAGVKPIAAIYSTFLQRAYDQTIHDVCIQRLPVIFCLDRAGLAGDDGITHHGMFDLAYLSPLPNLVIAAPKDLDEFEAMLQFAARHTAGPIAIRYPRGGVLRTPALPIVEYLDPKRPIQVGQGEWLVEGTDVALLALGSMVAPALEAVALLRQEGISASVINARWAKPLDTGLIEQAVQRHRAIVTIEEGVKRGGFGSAVLEYLEAQGINRVRIRVVGLPDRFVEHGKRELLLEQGGLTSPAIAEHAKSVLAQAPSLSSV